MYAWQLIGEEGGRGQPRQCCRNDPNRSLYIMYHLAFIKWLPLALGPVVSPPTVSQVTLTSCLRKLLLCSPLKVWVKWKHSVKISAEGASRNPCLWGKHLERVAVEARLPSQGGTARFSVPVGLIPRATKVATDLRIISRGHQKGSHDHPPEIVFYQDVST